MVNKYLDCYCKKEGIKSIPVNSLFLIQVICCHIYDWSKLICKGFSTYKNTSKYIVFRIS